jgi:hypothetical protein
VFRRRGAQQNSIAGLELKNSLLFAHLFIPNYLPWSDPLFIDERHFSRDRQEYRKKSRGLLPKRKGRKITIKYQEPNSPAPEIMIIGVQQFLLS